MPLTVTPRCNPGLRNNVYHSKTTPTPNEITSITSLAPPPGRRDA